MTVIKDVSANADSGTATKWGGNNIMFVDNYWDDIDVSGSIVNGLGVIRINTTTRFRSTKFTLRDSGNDHNYVFVTSDIVANRNVTLPLITADSKFVMDNFANDFGDFDQSFKDNRIRIWNPADTFRYTLVAAAIAANRTLNLPLITATDTLAVLGLAQTFTATQIFNSIKIGTNARILFDDSLETAERTYTFPDISDAVNTKTLGINNPYVGAGTGATLVRTGIWVGIGDTTCEGLLNSGCTAIGTGAVLNDTTEGRGRSFATGAVANNNGGLRWTTVMFRREWRNYMIVRVSFSSTSDIRVFIGWSSDNADIAGETTLNNFSGAGVGKRTGDTNWFTMRNDGDATEDRVDTGVAFGTAAVTIQLELDATSFRSKIGSTTNTAQTTEIPASTTMLAPHVQIETGAGAADKTINIFPVWATIGGQVMI